MATGDEWAAYNTDVAQASFGKALDAAIAALPEMANDIKIRSALDLMNRIILMTPVDTGRARGNWQLTQRSPATGKISEDDANVSKAEAPPSGIMKQAEQTAIGSQPGDDIWISNNLPYIEVLEEGHSKQAPHGMVALALVEVEQGLGLI
jgi:hypothetical protein|tara:strand:- start:3413 stop:3862 length:450 start_codon:yes stop_codon:yes gene_type:complete